MRAGKKGTIRAAMALGALGMVAAACGSGSSSSTTTTGGSATTAASGGNVALAQSLINQYTGNPKFVSPGPSFDATKLAGKTIFSIPANSAVPFVNTVDQVMGQYAKKLGINYVDYTNQQQQSQWVQGMNQAISQKANVIDLLAGIPPEMLAPQVQAAKAAGIPTVDTNERDPSQPTDPNVAAYTFAPFKLAGELMAAWAVAQTQGKADVLVVTSNADVSSQAVQNGVNQEMAKVCPSCKISAVNVNPVDWATKLQTTVEGSLAGDPGINYILPVFDSMALFIAPAITAANKVGQVHVASFNGTPAIIDMIRTGNIVSMDVGENTSAVAAAGLDQAMRIMAGMQPGNEQIIPRIVDKSNVTDFGVPAASGQGYGNAFLQGYASTWKVPVSTLQ
ncbi:MAG: sugar ABC transporter substrate-binding protein [Actinomycetota bacterium]|nr:sugar ABC transporter substrate-binding protein [Actinomycetota bacterium]MDA8209392.1 sugar ABC transporter substrate-binding protein [Actinomycetota bacterium]